MKEFKIPVSWEMYGCIKVEADTAEEALRIAEKKENAGMGFALPNNAEYIDASFKIENDIDLINFLNQ